VFPRERSNPDGTHPFAYQTLIWRLQRWARICDVREEDGARRT
jgi:hypothetical protein